MDTKKMAERFLADNYAIGLTGVEFVEVREDYIKTKLVVDSKHMNAFGMVQGGAIFTLADFTFAVAINREEKKSVVAIECHISYLKPVTAGVLYAESQLVSMSRSLIACDITITDDRGNVVAKFLGRGFIRQSVEPLVDA